MPTTNPKTGSINLPGFSMTWPIPTTVNNPVYSQNPSPTAGQGPFGEVPGVTGLPDIYGDLSKVYPNLGASNAAASSGILARMRGQLSQETKDAMQDTMAKYGISSGMPLSDLVRYGEGRNVGLATEQLQRAGLTDYLNALYGIGKTQTIAPETQIGLSQTNAQLSAAPNPAAANTYAKTLFDQYLANTRNSGGRPSGGTGGYAGPNIGGIPFMMSPSTPSAPSSGIDPYAIAPSTSGNYLGQPAGSWEASSSVQPTDWTANDYQMPLYDPAYGMSPDYFGQAPSWDVPDPTIAAIDSYLSGDEFLNL